MRTVDELYDYEHLRHSAQPTMFVVEADAPTIVLGGHQSLSDLDEDACASTPIRRRRGGGGAVLVQPGDAWVDWWVPAGDPRWSHDVRASSILAGTWWRDVLGQFVDGAITVHEGPLEGRAEHRSVCFAGRGPGEVFVDDRKAVGVTQWRVREGVFVSSVVHAGPTSDLLAFLNDPPDGLAAELDHHLVATLSDVGRERMIDHLEQRSGPWLVRHHRVS